MSPSPAPQVLVQMVQLTPVSVPEGLRPSMVCSESVRAKASRRLHSTSHFPQAPAHPASHTCHLVV